MKIEDLLDLCQSYSDLGWAVQEQLAAVIEGEALEDQNGNALAMIRKFLEQCGNSGVSGAFVIADSIEHHLSEQAAS